MPGRTDSRSRLLLLLIVLVVASGSLLVRLSYWQVIRRDDLAAAALAQTTVRTEIPARRGDIFDRSGTVVLATTVDRYQLAATPNMLTPARRIEVADSLVTILGLDPAAAATLQGLMTSDRAYVVLASGLDPKVADQVRAGLSDGTLDQLTLTAQPTRVYPQPGGGPNTSLAAQLIGFVNGAGAGQYGVEQAYQSTLAGQPQVVVAQRDSSGQPMPATANVIDAGVPGSDIMLTIDAGLQLALEQELVATYTADQAKSVSAVVMDPRTGEVYAEGSYPSYDANQYQAVASTDPALFQDPVVSSVYEPGSVMKMFTSVAALSRGTVGLMTKVNDSGRLKLDNGRNEVDDADRRAMGWIPYQDVVAWSRNVGVSRVALQLGPTLRASSAALFSTWQQFGLGKPTGIDVAGEVGGIVHDPAIKPWAQIDLANGSFGQGIAVTPIQLATGYSAMVNGGTLVQPHVVKSIGDQPVTVAPRAEGLVTPSLSEQLIGLMNHVVSSVPLYRDRTLVPGYFVGGKTGTAQIWDPTLNGGHGAFKQNLFNYSFVGFIGHDTPQLIVAVRIDQATPTVARVGEIELPVMSFELFRRIATNAITMLDLPDPIQGPTASVPASPEPGASGAPPATSPDPAPSAAGAPPGASPSPP
jgi:cell division protein FtsI/penicillin-binding protein 2